MSNHEKLLFIIHLVFCLLFSAKLANIVQINNVILLVYYVFYFTVRSIAKKMSTHMEKTKDIARNTQVYFVCPTGGPFSLDVLDEKK